MSQAVDAIYDGGVFKPLSDLALPDKQRVRLIVELDAELPGEPEVPGDPLAGLRVDMGVADFAENLDDYRFGRR